MDAVQKDKLLTPTQPQVASDGIRMPELSSGASLVIAEELLGSVCRRIATASCLADVKAIADEATAAAELVSEARRHCVPNVERELRRAERHAAMVADQKTRRS